MAIYVTLKRKRAQKGKVIATTWYPDVLILTT